MFKFMRENVSLLAVSWGHFVNDFFMSIVPVTLFAFATKLDLSATEITMILFIITTAGTFFQPIIGLLIDRVQKSSLLIYALIGITIGMSISGFITNFCLLIVVVGVAALGSSVYHPLGSTITIHKTNLSRGKSLSVFMTVGSFAHSVAPLVAIPLVTLYGVEALIFLMIPGLLTAFLLYIAKVQDVKWTSEKTHDDESKKTKKLLTKKQQIKLSVPMTIAVVKKTIYSVIVVFGVIIMSTKGIDTVQAALIISLFMFSRAIATFAGGFISDHLGEKKTLLFLNGLTAVSLMLFVYSSGLSIAIGLILLGFSLNSTSAANITITHKIVPENVNYGTGLIMGLAGTISAVVMLGYGYLVDLYGQGVTLNLLVALSVATVALTFLAPGDEDKEQLQGVHESAV